MTSRISKLQQIYRKSISQSVPGRTATMNAKLERRRVQNQALVSKFITTNDMPGWFRGLSPSQIKAAEELVFALQNDAVESSSHRVRNIMSRLGLHPVVNHRETRVLMRYAQENDLAFLWFLMEKHYKSHGSEYTINEQLLCSTIAHLDMITTLRELDRILPPPQLPKTCLKHVKRTRQRVPVDRNFTKKWLRWKKKGLGPYFEPVGVPKVLEPPEELRQSFPVNFKPYEYYKDHSIIMVNESNRWYEKYQLRPGRRIVHHVLEELFQKVVEKAESHTYKREGRSLCAHHKVAEELKRHRETELKIMHRERCLESMGQFTENRVKRIRDQLEEEVEKYLTRSRKAAQAKQQYVVQEISSESGVYIVQDDLEYTSLHDVGKKHRKNGKDKDKETRKILVTKDMSSNTRVSTIRQMAGKDVAVIVRGEAGDCATQNPCQANCFYDNQEDAGQGECDSTHRTKPWCSLGGGDGIRRVSRTISSEGKYFAKYDYGHDKAPTPSPSDLFFQAPTKHKPYRFDYRKIFSFEEKNLPKKLDIKRAFVQAVDSALKLQKGELPNMDAAVKKCVKKIWKQQVKKKNAETEAMLKAENELERQIEEDEEAQKKALRLGDFEMYLLRKPSKRRKTPLDYTAQYFDPDDLKLMDQMLKDALCYMKKNPRFVLASMPEAHKLPMLRVWIGHRFGRRYTQNDLNRAVNLSMQIFKALEKVSTILPLPKTTTYMGEMKDYPCHEELIKRALHIKQQYQEYFTNTLMEKSRIIWYAMHPYLCSPPMMTFYAYMPSRISDINSHPWISTDFKNIKKHREDVKYRAEVL